MKVLCLKKDKEERKEWFQRNIIVLVYQYVDDYLSRQGIGIGLAYISELPHTFQIFMESCFFEKLLGMFSI